MDSLENAPPTLEERALAKSEAILARKQAAYDAEYAKRLKRFEEQEALAATGRRRTGNQVVHPDHSSVMIEKLKAIRSRTAWIKAKTAMLPASKSAQAVRRNFTDPQSRLMKTRKGFDQAYNTQFAVSDDHVILAAEVVDDPVDVRMFEPMLAAVEREFVAVTRQKPDIGVVLADAGYHTVRNLECPGPRRLISDRKSRRLADVDLDAEVSAFESVQRMREDLAKPENQELYKRRGALVEPVNAWVKEHRGLGRMSMRGLAKAAGEVKLMAAVVNIGSLCQVRALTVPVG